MSIVSSRTGTDLQLIRTGTHAERYNAFRDSVHELIRKDYSLALNVGQQNKHIEGTAEFDPKRSKLNAAPEELIRLYAGRSNPIMPSNGIWNQRERFAHTFEIGVWRNEEGLLLPTNRGIIHYSKRRGVHIVPADPRG